jgi:hypothetical protein
MNSYNIKRLCTFIGAFTLVLASTADVVEAQARREPTLEVALGWVGFVDDGIASEPLVGGAARFYLRPRISVGPELVYMRGERHNHLAVTGNVTWDLMVPVNGRPPRATPFLVVGGGMFQTRESFSTGSFTSREGAFTAGGGLRAVIRHGIVVGLDARVGWETHVRVNGLIGIDLGR